MIASLPMLGVMLCGAALAAAALALQRGAARQRWEQAGARLDGKLRQLSLPISGRLLVHVQAGAALFFFLAALLSRTPLLLPAALLPPLLVRGWLNWRRRVWLIRLEAQIDGWLQLLANAMRSSPSLGEAISSTVPLLDKPLAGQIDRLCNEVRLGQPLDAALRAAGQRVGSRVFGSALQLLVVARHSGGDLPALLQKSAAALREIARLEGVVRSKTAEGRTQSYVLAAMPLLISWAIHQISPDILPVLVQSTLGWVILGIAAALWLGSVLIARRVLAVQV